MQGQPLEGGNWWAEISWEFVLMLVVVKPGWRQKHAGAFESEIYMMRDFESMYCSVVIFTVTCAC